MTTAEIYVSGSQHRRGRAKFQYNFECVPLKLLLSLMDNKYSIFTFEEKKRVLLSIFTIYLQFSVAARATSLQIVVRFTLLSIVLCNCMQINFVYGRVPFDWNI